MVKPVVSLVSPRSNRVTPPEAGTEFIRTHTVTVMALLTQGVFTLVEFGTNTQLAFVARSRWIAPLAIPFRSGAKSGIVEVTGGRKLSEAKVPLLVPELSSITVGVDCRSNFQVDIGEEGGMTVQVVPLPV